MSSPQRPVFCRNESQTGLIEKRGPAQTANRHAFPIKFGIINYLQDAWMETLIVQGGQRLTGTVRAAGSKNAALPILACSLLVDGVTRLQNVPALRDVETMTRLLGTLGVQCVAPSSGVWEILPEKVQPTAADFELAQSMRASICLLGPLLGRYGRASLPLPGGCALGDRPIDLHLHGLKALGASIILQNDCLHATATRLRGCRVNLAGSYGSTVLGTCNVMSAATTARGTTVIENAAREPEVVDVGHFLRDCGARIEGLGTSTVRIHGVHKLTPTDYTIIPDRIEASTLLLAAAITGGEITLNAIRADHLQAVLKALLFCGAEIECESNRSPHHEGTLQRVRLRMPGLPRPLQMTARPYPGLPTDVQAQVMALLTQANGLSVITDEVFPQRFAHVAELRKFGARLARRGNTVTVNGGTPLRAAVVQASDLRASAALVLAALSATGISEIHHITHLDRGYEQLESKLTALGAQVQRRQLVAVV